jgi:stage II sporulation protein P
MMYKRRGVGAALTGCVLAAATLGSSAYALRHANGAQWVAYISSALCAPQAAVPAAQKVLQNTLAAAQPTQIAAESVSVSASAPQAAETESTEATSSSAAPSEADVAPTISSDTTEIPEGMVPLELTHYGQGSGTGYVNSGAATVRNNTSLSDADVASEMMQALPFSVEIGTQDPQVLIMHTHATESYELAESTWCDPSYSARSTDNALNMIAVGAQIAAQLNDAGIATIQDTTLHDYPSYNGSYERSNATVRSYLAQYPSIKVVLDVHRDAIQRDDGTRVAPVANINGLRAAQVMIICGADLNGNLPNFRQNLRFASRWQDAMERLYPGLTRPVLFDYRYYNQDLTTGSLLIEIGGHANTLEEAKYAGQLVGSALATLFLEEANT